MENSVAKPRVTPKDFFLWLGGMVALYVSVISLITLLFQYINVLFPEPLEYYDPYSGAIRFAIASLIVVFPLYIFLTRVLHQDLRKNPEKKELWVRRWLIYLTLFVAGVTIALDLIFLINTYLQGELTARFAWKALTILVIVGAGFWYYAYELKGTWEKKEKESKLIAALVSLAVLAAIVGGFFIIGSPATQRLVKFDNQRVSDLQNIQWQVINFYQQKERLPQLPGELEDPLVGFIMPKDPETGETYRYRPTEDLSFELCATFSLASSEIPGRKEPTPARPVTTSAFDPYSENWEHDAGEQCFERTIDPERFPPYGTKEAALYGRD